MKAWLVRDKYESCSAAVVFAETRGKAKAAAKSRRMLPDAEIDIYTQDTHVSYSACGLPYYIEGNFEDWRKLLIRSVEEFEKSSKLG